MPTTATQLLHLKIEIQTCKSSIPFTFVNTNNTQYHSFYATSANQNFFDTPPYDFTVYTNPTARVCNNLCAS